MFDLFKIGVYILLFVPGYIFVQTKDHHLLREKKPQFEKTLEIVLWTAIIWVVAFSVPSWSWCTGSRDAICSVINGSIAKKDGLAYLPVEIMRHGRSSGLLFLCVCFWSFFMSNIWGWARKKTWIDSYVKFITGRDWYPSVVFRFFSENIDKAVQVSVNGTKYIGILFSAPDTKEDKYIIITNPHQIVSNENGEFSLEKLELVDFMAIKFNNIDEIRAFSEELLMEKVQEQEEVSYAKDQ